MNLRVGNLRNGQAGLTESVFIQEGNHVIVLGTVGYGKAVVPSSILEGSKIAITLAAMADIEDLRPESGEG